MVYRAFSSLQVVPPFTCVELNAMRLQHPDLVFVALYQHLFGCKPQSTQQAFAVLDRKFTGESHAETFDHWMDAPRKKRNFNKLHDFDQPMCAPTFVVLCGLALWIQMRKKHKIES